MDPKQILELMNAAIAQARAIINAADAAAGGPNKGTLSAEQQAQVDAAYADYDKHKAAYDAAIANQGRRDRLSQHEAWLGESAGRQTAGAGTSRPTAENGPFEMQVHGRTIRIAANHRDYARTQDAYRRATGDYILNGVQAGMMASDNPKGGYLTTVQMAAGILQALDDAVVMRQLATVLPPLGQATSLGVVSLDTDPADADWTAEVPAADMTEDDTARLGKRELTPHLCSKLVKLSMKLLRAATVNPEMLLMDRVAYKFGVTEEKGFLTGTGAQQPLGVFVASNDGIDTSRDNACASQTVFTADEVIDTFYALKPQYQSRATWLAHRDWVKRIRKFKSGDGAYLWQPAMSAGNPETVLGRPVVQSENAPNTFTTGKYVAVVGDFKAGYWIVDSLQLEIQRLAELFARTNQVGFIARKETDGAPVLAEAFSRMVMA